jgi:hypothetical protein
MPAGDMRLYESLYHGSELLTEVTLYTQFETTVQWRALYAGGGVTVYFWPTSNVPFFHPFRGDFLFFVGFDFGGVEIGFRHVCAHGITPFLFRHRFYSASDEALNQVFIRFGG